MGTFPAFNHRVGSIDIVNAATHRRDCHLSQSNNSGTSVYGHVTRKVTSLLWSPFAQSEIISNSEKTRILVPVIWSPLYI